MSGVALRKRDGLGYRVPLDAFCLGHSYAVADGGERLVGSAATLLAKERALRNRVAVRHLPSK